MLDLGLARHTTQTAARELTVCSLRIHQQEASENIGKPQTAPCSYLQYFTHEHAELI
jgi:hypothetical protein